LLDAAGTGTTPKGAVSAGGGGLAAVLDGTDLGAGSDTAGLLGTALLLLAAAGVMFRRPRRRAGGHVTG
jgi:hypothetical protein